ncbi:MAG: hypothetical protein CMJ44_07395 [Pimelobacter sp.]|nr:hypothetical protein [Pimelobacter sp.]
MFEQNLGSANLSLFVTAEEAATGTVSGPGMDPVPFTVDPGEVTTIPIPSDREVLASGSITAQGVHVEADTDVTVYGLNQSDFTTDAFLGLPVDLLDTEYLILDAPNTVFHDSDAAQFGIVATQDNTEVTIQFNGEYGGDTPPVAQFLTLAEGETFQWQNYGSGTANLSGTSIVATAPVAVFAGNKCTNIPGTASVGACDHVVEQLFPESTWGTNFLSSPLATRTGGDTFRMIAGSDATEVLLDGVPVATLDRGETYEAVIDGAHRWEATAPVMLAQYSNSSDFDGVVSDPFMMLVPPVEQFLSLYTVSTPPSGIGNNFLNVVVANDAVGSVRLDGAPVETSNFTEIGATGFSSAQLSVGIGQHRVVADDSFGLTVYGFDEYDSYGYPGGLSLAPIALDDDGDALPNDWEINGVDIDGDGDIDLDLPAMGADPNVPDLFIEVDWMEKAQSCVWFYCWGGKSFKPMQSAIDDVVAAFEDSPYGPIRLHVDAGPASVMDPLTGATWGSRSESSSLPHTKVLGSYNQQTGYNWTQFNALQRDHFSEARREVFHYAVYADRYQGDGSAGCPSGQCSSGISRGIPADAFIVSDGPWDEDGGFTRTQERGTFMHEFGHNLDLYHGGGPQGTSQGSPAYRSIMNYAYQLTGIGSSQLLDYSGDAPYDDWLNVRFDGGGIGALGIDAGPPEDTVADSLTYPEALADGTLAIDGDGSVTFEGPMAVIPGTGKREILFTIDNPSASPAIYSLSLDTPLPLVDPAPVRVEPRSSATLKVIVRTDSAVPGDYPVVATLDSDVAGPAIATIEALVTVPDTTQPGFDDQLQDISDAVGDLGPDELDPAVVDLVGDQIEDFTSPPPPAAPRCQGKVATIVGTNGADKLRGTAGRDVIIGMSGNDRILGLGGNDIICGGGGKDTIRGGSGKDRVQGDAGADALMGGAGNDRLMGGGGRDRILGNAGRDRLVGGPGRDRLNGGPGRDREKQ